MEFLDLRWTKTFLNYKLSFLALGYTHLVDVGLFASVALGLDLCTISLCRVTYLMLVRAGLMHNVSYVQALLPLCRLTYLVPQLSKTPFHIHQSAVSTNLWALSRLTAGRVGAHIFIFV